jgi:IclR family acetate operon transcriptional repressor
VAAHTLVTRTLQIIELLAQNPDGQSVTKIASHLGMPASASHRLLLTLTDHGIVEQDEKTKEYRLTLALPALGLRYLSSFSFLEICRPAMASLAQETKELVRLAVVNNAKLTWVAKAQGSKSSLRIDPLEGRHAIPHITAAGKAWLASMPDDRVRTIMSDPAYKFRSPKQFGPQAISSFERLLADLALARRRTFAITYDEAEAGIAAVGAVIRNGPDDQATAVGTISVAGPSARLPVKSLDRIGPLVAKIARDLSAVWPATTQINA